MGMKSTKFFGAITFSVIAIALTAYFWRNLPLVTILLAILALMKKNMIPVKHEGFWYFVPFVIGPFFEYLIIFLGSNPWSYVQNNIVNFPLWLPFLWGMAGMIMGLLFEAFNSNNN